LAAEKDLEQFATPELPIIENAFQITHQQAAEIDNVQSPRVILRTLLEHIGGPGGGYIEEVTKEEEKGDEEEQGHQLQTTDQLPGVGNATGTHGAKDGPPMGD
jgi:hypothetical protein